jgi:hypothetical protein
MIIRTLGTALATVALCLGGAVAVAGTAYADAGKRCQGEELESIPFYNSSGAPQGRVQRFREASGGNCAETYGAVGDGARITTFVIVHGHVKIAEGRGSSVSWPAQKGCVILGGSVNEYKVTAKACG